MRKKSSVYTYSEGPAAARDSLLTPASFLLLQRDGSYTRDFGGFEYGAWTEKDNQLVLTNQQCILRKQDVS